MHSLPSARKQGGHFPTSADAHWSASPASALGSLMWGLIGMSRSPERHTVREATSPAAASADAVTALTHRTRMSFALDESRQGFPRPREAVLQLQGPQFPWCLFWMIFIDAYANRRKSEIPRLRLHPSFSPDSARKRKDGHFTPSCGLCFLSSPCLILVVELYDQISD